MTARPRRLVVIIPAFGEEASLGATLDELIAHLEPACPALAQSEVVVVDDGSTDRTRDVACARRATVLAHACNLGYGAAVSTGLKYALSRAADVAVILDADGQHDPAALGSLLEPVLSGKADVVIGSRFLPGVAYHTSFTRRLGSVLFGLVTSIMARRRVYDTTSGFQCMGRDALALLAVDYPIDYPDSQVILELIASGLRVVEVPAAVRPRTAGRSMHSLVSVVSYPPRMLTSLLVAALRQMLRRGSRRTPTRERGD